MPSRRNPEMSNMPAPIEENWEWQINGACRRYDPEQFYHPEGERGFARRERARVAKGICAQCPVIEKCREYALYAREPYGIWGGLTEEDREAIYSNNRRTLQRAIAGAVKNSQTSNAFRA